MSNTTNTKIFKSPSETYQQISNDAKQEELHNPFGFDLWSRDTIRRLLRDGLKVYNYNQDTHRYKQMGNSVAVPVIEEVTKLMLSCYVGRKV